MDHLDIEALVVALDSDLDSELNRLTRVPLGQARAAVRSSALGVTGSSIQLAIASNEYGSSVERVPGDLAYRQRVKRFLQARAAVRSSALGVTVISHRLGMECAESFNPCAARPGPRRRAFERVGRDRYFPSLGYGVRRIV